MQFNLTFRHETQNKHGWTSMEHYGINLGPIVLMCENYRTGLLWRLMRSCPYLVSGLRRAGFVNGGHVADARFGSRMDETIDSVAIWNTPGISVAEILSGLAVARRMRTPAGCATAK